MAIKKLTEHVPIDDALLGDINVIFNKFKKSGLLYRCTFAQLSKHLLSNFLPVRIFAVNYSELRDSYLENIDFEGIKKKAEAESDDSTYFSFNKSQVETIEKALINEVEFHKHICKTYLNLAKEPKEVLLENFLKAQEDLKEIDERLLKIESQLEAITIENNALEKQQRKPVLDYYKTYNLKAKDDILNFIKNEAQDFALSQSYERSIYTSFFLTQPYNYHSDTFEPQFPNSIENKFGELPISQLRKLLKLYKDDKIAFNQYITQHIDNHQIVFQLQALVREHHLLDVRSEIINEALNIYENGAKIMFANAVPTIIEGVFHDLCIEIGEDENELLQQGFQYKLDKLKDTLSYELYYEYYAFKFRLFRNKVAHGRLTVDDVNELSDLLLLDLFQVCKLVSSTKLPLTQKRFLIDTITSEEDKSANYEKVLEYLILDDIEIPDFYNLEAQILEVEDVIASDKFWEYLDAQITDTNEVTRHGIAGILAIIKKKGAYDDKCNSLFKKLRIGKVKKSLKDSYFKRLRNYY